MLPLTIPSPEEQPTVDVPFAGRALGIGKNAAYDAVKRGDIPSIRVGGKIRVPTAALRRMLRLDEHATDPTAA